jgi:guanylate kinase
MLFVLSAPSGAGKTTVAGKLLERVPGLCRVVTATTRQRREGEVHGVDYLFMSQEEFKEGIERAFFLEHALVYGNYYGTPRDQVMKNEEMGIDSLLIIDVQGAKRIREQQDIKNVLIFLLPPSFEELRRRLLGRGYKDTNLEERLRAAEKEIACAKHFDYIVVNEFLDYTVNALTHIIMSYKHTRERFLKSAESLKDEAIRRVLRELECVY